MPTDDQKQQIRQKIKEKLKEIQESIKALEEVTKPISPDNAIGRITRMDAIYTSKIHQANLNTALYSQVKLEEALVKIEEENFGMCAWCNQPIDFNRLSAMPESDRCIRCA